MKCMDGCGFLGLHLDITTRSAKNIKNSGEKLLLLETSHTVGGVISMLAGVEGKQLLLGSCCSISYWPCVKHSDEKKATEKRKRANNNLTAYKKDFLSRKSFLLCVFVGFDENGFIVRIDDESRLAFVRFFNEFAFTVIDGNFIAIPSVGVIGAYFGGE